MTGASFDTYPLGDFVLREHAKLMKTGERERRNRENDMRKRPEKEERVVARARKQKGL